MAAILAMDQGTTSCRAIVFDDSGMIRAVAQREFAQVFPQPGWVEHDPNEIWRAQLGVSEEALRKAGLTAGDVATIGITNQRETTVVWDRATGEPIHNAIVWQDRRTAAACDRLQAAGAAPVVREKTGLVIDAYFSGTKAAWLLDHVTGARQRAERGELAFGTIDSWLVWKLTGGTRHVTDVSNASRTMLFDIHAGHWDDELLSLLKVPREVLPDVCRSSEVYADVQGDTPLAGIPIAGIAGDQQAALFGQACFAAGQAKNTYGTGCFVLMQTGVHPMPSQSGLVTTCAWQTGERMEYALEGSIFVAGAVVQWLRDGLGIIKSSADVERLALSVPDNGGVYLVPAFAGLGAPHWDPYARGTIIGITRGTSAGHIARAALEGIAFQVGDLVAAMQNDAGEPMTELRVDGGAAANNMLLQLQADLLQAPVVRPTVTETTALGAAYLAGLATGVWKDRTEIARQWHVDRRFEPTLPAERAAALRERWSLAVARSKRWATEG
jgi:glycerol kinase